MQDKYIIIGLVSGSIISILSLYMLSVDAKAVSYTKDQATAKRIAVLGYGKRFVIYALYLAGILYFLDFKYFISGVMGLLNLKINVFIIVFTEKIKKFKN